MNCECYDSYFLTLPTLIVHGMDRVNYHFGRLCELV